MESSACAHVNEIREVVPSSSDACESCLAMGDTWVHLRICLICGHVGCCDNSKNRHARAHFDETGHKIIQSYERGESWRHCYADDVLLPSGEPVRGR